MDLTLLIPVLGGAARSFTGWLQNSLADGKIDAFEWGKLGGTILEVAVLAFSAMYGLNVGPEAATGLGVIGSFLLSGMKKVGAKA